jgi:putative endonuclease
LAFYAYILASQRNGTLYIGHTDSISRRIWQHQEGESQGSNLAMSLTASSILRMQA